MLVTRYSRLAVATVLTLVLALCLSVASGQNKVKLKQAKNLKSGRLPDGERFQRLVGEVIFTQGKTTIYSDSAHLYKKKNSLTAFGKVRIAEGDSVNITGKKLEYDGDKRLAKFRGNVVFNNGDMTLYTDNLDYSRPANIAYYFNGGKLVDSANVLTSWTGNLNIATDLASFKTNVKVVNPEHTMYADSLKYNSKTKMIYFVSKTTVINKDSSTFVYESGVHNTSTGVSMVKSGTAETEDYIITGDRYDMDAARNIAKVRGNVVMKHKKEDLVIHGEASDHDNNTGITKIFNNAYLAKVADNNDTLFMRADTLVSIDHKDPLQRRLLAYNSVRIYKSDLQGVADSVVYKSADSTIYFYKKPVLWSNENQLSADSIRMLIKHNTIHQVILLANAFVISADSLLNFNQIKGRKMTADIVNARINRVLVEGNGESLYFALDEKTNLLMGVNKSVCSNIIIRFKEGRVNNLTFLVKPEASFIPTHQLKKDELTLKGFSWKLKEKPTRKDVVPVKATAGSQ